MLELGVPLRCLSARDLMDAHECYVLLRFCALLCSAWLTQVPRRSSAAALASVA